MKYDEFKRMMHDLRQEVAVFTGGIKPSKDEIESLEIIVGYRLWSIYGKCSWNKKHFLHAIFNTVQNEIAKTCV